MTIRSRLILAFLALGLVAALSVGFLSYYATRGLFSDYVGSQRATRLEQWRDILAGYYAETGSWNGVGSILTPRAMGAGSGGRYGMGRMGGNPAGPKGVADSLVLTNVQGSVIAGALPAGQQVGADALTAGLDVIAAGRNVGKLVDLTSPTTLAAADATFIATASRAILAGAVVIAILAVIVGAALARRIAAPISDLTVAVARDGRGPVPVAGSGEVRSLAVAFNGMLDRLGRNEQVRRTMVSDIAHELRTPLTVLGTHLENLGGRVDGEAAAEVMTLQDEVLRLNRLVGDLQTLSLADAGALTLNRRPTDLRALLGRIVELTSPVAAERSITVRLTAPAGAQAFVDSDRITQAVLNLVTNSLRHTPEDGSVTIGLEAATATAGPVISVADTGTGISPEDLPRIFERFYRADPARGRGGPAGSGDANAGSGSGLGLAIVRGIVEAHGGTVSAESLAGKGALFRIRLPQDAPAKT